MGACTKDGRIRQARINDRDKRFNISTRDKKEHRQNIPMPDVDPMANAWEKGQLRQFVITHEVDSAVMKH